MSDGKLVKDVMVGIFEYPHVLHSVSVRRTISIIRDSFFAAGKYPEPVAVLVVDEKSNLIGALTLKDILKGIEPRFLKPTATAQVPEEDEAALSVIWDSLFAKESKELAEKPVIDITPPARYLLRTADFITKAAYLMLHHDLALLPVLENGKKFVGLVRMTEVFDEISNALLKE